MTVSRAKFYGGCNTASFGSDYAITTELGRLQRLTPTTSGLAVALPDARIVPSVGGPVFVLHNEGAHDLDVEDASGGSVGTLPAGYFTIVLLSQQTDAAGVWHIDPTADPAPASSSSISMDTSSPGPEPGGSNFGGGRTGAPA